MKYKAIFSDFDGTLLSDDFTVSKKNIDALNDYVNKGGKFFISTGRLFQSIFPQLVKLGVKSEMIICAQGAEVYDIKDGKKLLLQETISLDTLKKIARFLESQYDIDENLVPLMYVNDEVYFFNRNNEYLGKSVVPEGTIQAGKSATKEIKVYYTDSNASQVAFFEFRCNAVAYKGQQTYNVGVGYCNVKSWERA